MLYIYIYIYIKAGSLFLSRMLNALVLFRMLYYASTFSILDSWGRMLTNAHFTFQYFILVLKDALFYKASFHYPWLKTYIHITVHMQRAIAYASIRRGDISEYYSTQFSPLIASDIL